MSAVVVGELLSSPPLAKTAIAAATAINTATPIMMTRALIDEEFELFLCPCAMSVLL
jgi:hypothetical protein